MGHKSIYQKTKSCAASSNTNLFGDCAGELEWHHIYYGSANRKKSDIEGCTCWLCLNHHRGAKGIHTGNRKLDNYLKEDCEAVWLKETNKSIDDFIKIFGKNYL